MSSVFMWNCRIAAFSILVATAIFGAIDAPAVAGPVAAGYTCAGNCGTDGADGVVALSPLGDSQYNFISTNGGATGVGELSGIGGTNGSTLTTPVFLATAGAALNFYFDFVTSDGGGNFSDYAWAELINASNQAVVATIFTARTEPSGSIVPGQGLPADNATLNPASVPIKAGTTWSPLGSYSGACYTTGCGNTGWVNSNYTITTAGSYDLIFGVTNIGDTGFDTGLAVDGVTVAGVSVGAPVPEPASISLLGLGLAVLGFMRFRARTSLPR
jgi:hypothetical protein